MFGLVFYLVLVVGLVATLDDEKMEICSKMHPGMMACCETANISPDMFFLPEVKECFAKEEIRTCKADECLAKKLGYYGDDGKLDTEKFTSLMEKKFANEPQILDSIKENCLNVDISTLGLGKSYACDFTNMNICVHLNFKEGCSKWTDEGDCKGVPELEEMCGF